jgi:hypothetical protein
VGTTGERVTYATLAAGQTEAFRPRFDQPPSRWRAAMVRAVSRTLEVR